MSSGIPVTVDAHTVLTAGRLPVVAVEKAEDASRRLRLSLTDRCNFNCIFCHNEGQVGALRRRDALTVADHTRLAGALRLAGITSIKLTGGEPTIYSAPDGALTDVIRTIVAAYSGNQLDLSMTTNGWHLADQSDSLFEAGLRRITVSLGSLDRDTHSRIFQGRSGDPRRILAGIKAASDSGFDPIKINTVVLDDSESGKGNLSELADIFAASHEAGAKEIRLYPMLRTRSNAEFQQRYIYWNRKLVTAIDRAFGKVGSSRYLDQAQGVFEDILDGRYTKLASGSRFELRIPFSDSLTVSVNLMPADRPDTSCSTCEDPAACQEGLYALRLSAKGEFRTCLNSHPIGNIAELLHADVTDAELAAEIGCARSLFEQAHTKGEFRKWR